MSRQSGSLISRRPLPLPHRRGTSWNPVVWLWRIWRYGWYHPDEDLLGVIDVAGDALRAQIASARAVLTGAAADKAKAIADEIEAELEGGDIPDLAKLLGFEAQINGLYPPALQRRRAWMLRERFERVAPGRAVLDYWASNPPDPAAAGMAEEELRRSEAGLREAVAERDRAQADAGAGGSAAETAEAEVTAQREAIVGKSDEQIESLLGELEVVRDADPPQDDDRRRELETVVGPLLAARQAAAAARARLAACKEAEQKAAAALRAAEAVREVARARIELLRVQRELAAAATAAREAATSGNPAQADAALSRLRDEHQAALTRLDNAEKALEDMGAEGVEAAINRRPTGHLSAIDADAQTLLGYIHSAYLMSVGREKAVRDLMRWLMMRFWSANIVAALILLIVYLFFRFVPGLQGQYLALGNLVVGLFFVAAVGRIGATMSVVQRLQSAIGGDILSRDAMQEITRLRTGKNGINVALFSGAVFALLFYAMFASGVAAAIGFDDGIFPEMIDTRAPPAEEEPAGSTAMGGEKTESSGTTGATGATAKEGGGSDEVAVNGAEAETGGENAVRDGNAVATEAPGPSDEAVANGTESVDSGNAAATAPAEEPKDDDEDDTVQCKAGEPCDPFRQLTEALGFADRSDFFKLLIWAFLAGFAERLVPDVLDSITRRTKAGVRVEEDAALLQRMQPGQTAGRTTTTTATTTTASGSG